MKDVKNWRSLLDYCDEISKHVKVSQQRVAFSSPNFFLKFDFITSVCLCERCLSIFHKSAPTRLHINLHPFVHPRKHYQSIDLSRYRQTLQQSQAISYQSQCQQVTQALHEAYFKAQYTNIFR